MRRQPNLLRTAFVAAYLTLGSACGRSNNEPSKTPESKLHWRTKSRSNNCDRSPACTWCAFTPENS
jgi:hypothetical protein